MPVLDAAKLLSTPGHQNRVREIEQLAAVPRHHFDALYCAALNAFARFVQQLPASEAHHHAGPGGLLDHTLDVVVRAMKLRRPHLLPPGADPEEINQQQHLWTYAVFCAALLHDIGKPVADQRVALLGANRRTEGVWNPWSGPMPMGGWYQMKFVRGRRYALHQAITPLLARGILPEAGLTWLASDPLVLGAWLATMTGQADQAGVVGGIVRQADGASVAHNLGGSGNILYTNTIPLHQKLMTALRHLITRGNLTLNRDGAVGWLAGDDVWLVSKRIVDALRDHLVQEGHTGIPARNDRIFDVLQEHGILIPNGERAIWVAEVKGEGWAHTLTVLRIHASRIWPDPATRPEPFKGAVTPQPNAIPPPDRDTERAGTPAEHAGATTATARSLTTLMPDEHPVAGAVSLPEDRAGKAKEAVGDPVSNDDLASGFLGWVRQGVAKGSLRINQADARVHTVPEGVLLISPAIFKDYARSIGNPEGWSRIQKAFCQRKIHLRALDDTNVHTYQVRLPEGNYNGKTPLLKGIVVTDTSLIFEHVPSVNAVLHKT
ncbi:MAG: TraI domain-containing protein [Gammaproteobacteria bacterium]|nr:TraI domain-containing protein [Gammaproteobacteria bacterium]